MNCILASAELVPSESEGEECTSLPGRAELESALDALDKRFRSCSASMETISGQHLPARRT